MMTIRVQAIWLRYSAITAAAILAAAVTAVGADERVAESNGLPTQSAAGLALPEEPFWFPDEAMIDAARQGLGEELKRLTDQLSELPIGLSIAGELRLDELKQSLERDDVDVSMLEGILRQVQRTRELPGTPLLKGLRKQLTAYVLLHRIDQLQDPVVRYEQTRKQLAAALRQYSESESQESLAQIADAHGWLAKYRQAPEARKLVAEHFVKPNMMLEAGEELLMLAKTVKIDRPFDVDQVAQGFRTTGKGAAKGTVDIHYVPNTAAAQVRVTFDGSAECAVKSRRRKVSVFGNMKVKVVGEQDILVKTAIESRAAVDMSVCCKYEPRCARVAAHCPVVAESLERIVLRVAQNKKPEIERASAGEVEKQVAREVAGIVDEQLTRVNNALGEQFLGPLNAANIAPRIATQTSDKALVMHGTIAAADQLAARNRSSLPEDASAAVRMKVHESFANNVSLLCEGLELDSIDYRCTLGELFGMELELDGSDDVYRYQQMIRFDLQSPVGVRFQEGLIWVTLRLQAFHDGEELHEGGPWEVRTAYQVEVRESQISLERVRPIEVVAEPEVAEKLQEVVSGILFQYAATTQYAAVSQTFHRLHIRFSSVQVGGEWLLLELQRQVEKSDSDDTIVMGIPDQDR